MIDIPSYSVYGPPDLCYLVKEKTTGGLRSKTTHQGYFHYVYGADTSSSASIAAYLKSIMDLPKGDKKSKVIQGIYCSFDIFTRKDIRVDIQVPGSTNVYSIDDEGSQEEVNGEEWNNVFVSSHLRCFE